MAARTRYAPDRGLTARMTATMFLLGLVFVAFVALELFLRLNGCAFPVGDAEAAVMMLAMAAGELPDDEFIAWEARAGSQTHGDGRSRRRARGIALPDKRVTLDDSAPRRRGEEALM